MIFVPDASKGRVAMENEIKTRAENIALLAVSRLDMEGTGHDYDMQIPEKIPLREVLETQVPASEAGVLKGNLGRRYFLAACHPCSEVRRKARSMWFGVHF